MKKALILSIVALSGIAIAATFTDVNSSTYWGKTAIPKLTEALDANFTIIETGSSAVYSNTTATVTASNVVVGANATITGEAVVDGKYAVVGPDATTGLMIDTGTCTNGQVVTFTAAFGAIPAVLVQPITTASNVTAVVTTTNLTATGVGAFTNKWIAVGNRP